MSASEKKRVKPKVQPRPEHILVAIFVALANRFKKGRLEIIAGDCCFHEIIYALKTSHPILHSFVFLDLENYPVRERPCSPIVNDALRNLFVCGFLSCPTGPLVLNPSAIRWFEEVGKKLFSEADLEEIELIASKLHLAENGEFGYPKNTLLLVI